ncbi:MAG TPA: YfiR family protein [Candidatus Limnocylindria bacterium]|nr:YfiR family protein [Candidatus Limnocylindria bacterium]
MARTVNNAQGSSGYFPAASRGFVTARAGIARLRLASAIGAFRRLACYTLIVGVVFAFSAPASAQVSKEFQLKAVFLWRLAQFTQWSSDAFESPDSPIVICVVGENPFGDALEAAVRDEVAQGRRFVVQYHRVIEQVKICHIVYLAGRASLQAKTLSAALAGKSILTVRDVDGPASPYNTIVAFVTEQNRIKLRINLKAATAARLILDPRLLRAAEVDGDK